MAPGNGSGDARFHLFLVHSHITHIVARGVVRQCCLEPQSVVFLTARGFQPPKPAEQATAYRVIPFDFTLVPHRRKERPSMLQGWKTLATIDRLLGDITAGCPFHLYTPQTMEHIAQVLKNSPACSGFSYIEEGLYSYCTREEIERTHPPRQPRVWERLAYRNRIRPSRFFDFGNEHAYGVHAAVFPDLQGRVVLDGVFPRADPASTEGIANVLVFDSLAVYRRIKLETLVAALQRLFARLREEQVASLHYKFHPAQVGTDEQAVLEHALSSAGLPVQRLADDVSLEGLALTRPATRWFVSLSSVGLYAALFGCPVYSYAHWIAKIEPGFQRYIEQTPRVFAEHVQGL